MITGCHIGKTFLLDGAHFDTVELTGCTLRYAGGELPQFTGTVNLNRCTFKFDDAAERTVIMMRGLAEFDPALVNAMIGGDGSRIADTRHIERPLHRDPTA